MQPNIHIKNSAEALDLKALQRLAFLPQTPNLPSWTFGVPFQHLGKPLLLLSITGNSFCGIWCGQIGEHYVGWAPIQSHHLAKLRNVH